MSQANRRFTGLRAALAVLATALATAALLASGPVTAAETATSSPSASLADVSCLSASFCMAVGSHRATGGAERALAEEWNGQGWRILRSASASRFPPSSVSCVSRTFCMAVGSGAALRWDGSRWRLLSGAALTGLTGVSCAGPAFCMAVGKNLGGDANLSSSWNGRAWRSLRTPDTGCVPFCGLARVSCPTAKGCMAVGSTMNNAGDMGTAAAITWNGRAWHVHNAPSPDIDPGLSGVSCTRGLRCTAVGGYTTDAPPCQCVLIVTWNVSTWQQVTAPTFTGLPSAVSCPLSARCVAVGGTLALVEGAAGWTQVTIAVPAGSAGSLGGVSCWRPSACIAVGHYAAPGGAQRTLAERWNGHAWMVIPTRNPQLVSAPALMSG